MSNAYPIFTYTITFVITILAVMIEWSHFKSVFTHPGYLYSFKSINDDDPYIEEIKDRTKKMKAVITDNRKKLRNFRIRNEDIENNFDMSREDIQRLINEQYIMHIKDELFCFNCQLVKPARAHHCKSCNRCVRRMDHHCPWTGNCVGEDNIRYFIQFLGYASVNLVICFLLALIVFVTSDQDFGEVPNLFIKFNCIFSMIIGLAIGYLFVYQIRNAFANLTTVEDNIDGIMELKPFDKGRTENLKEIYGERIEWKYVLLPISK